MIWEIEVKNRYFFLFLIFLAFANCGDESPKNTTSTTSTWAGATNGSGYPDVAGNYSFKTSKNSWKCSDKSSGTGDAGSFNVLITQSVNTITATNSSFTSIPGITVIESTETTGNIEKDASFILSQTTIASIEGFSGKETINYHLDGAFTTSGWSGNYSYSVYFQDYKLTCDYSMTFSGDKVITQTAEPLFEPSNDIKENLGLLMGM